jgi:hypothetical protein
MNKDWQRVRESNPLLKSRGAAQFRHKHALACALREKMQIHHFARIAQNYAVPVSDFVRNHLLPNEPSSQDRARIVFDCRMANHAAMMLSANFAQWTKRARAGPHGPTKRRLNMPDSSLRISFLELNGFRLEPTAVRQDAHI